MNAALDKILVSRPGRLSGIPCFANTRVPVQTLFDHLQEGFTLDEFLADFPSVTKDQATAVLDQAGLWIQQAAR